MVEPARNLPAVRERPVLFSGEMVRAILDGRKTQTRRPIGDNWWRCLDAEDEDDRARAIAMCPFGVVGDRLWVRETWCSGDQYYQSHENEVPAHVGYRADRSAIQWDAEPPRRIPAYDIAQWNWDMAVWRPSIHMPRWASRLTLEITGVRVERLQDISEEDAKAEGLSRCAFFYPEEPGDCFLGTKRVGGKVLPFSYVTASQAFESIWDSLYAKQAPWSDNPWVWVIAFQRIPKESP